MNISIRIDAHNAVINVTKAPETCANMQLESIVDATGLAQWRPQPTVEKVLSDGTHLPASDPRTDHVALLDNATGLMWSVESLGSEKDANLGASHAECEKRVAALRLLGHDDWRLPTRSELAALVDDTRSEPAIDVTLFPRVKPTWHWTSTPFANRDGRASASDAWFVGFNRGYVDYDHRSGLGFALAVRRAGQ